MSRWIRCSTRMPIPGAHVLAWAPGNPLRVAYYTGKIWILAFAVVSIERATHWQPLPKPPRVRR